MDWLARVLVDLAKASEWGYARGGASATEPAALAGWALTCAGDEASARQSLDWLVTVQAENGCLGVGAMQQDPHWATAWALATWTAYADLTGSDRYEAPARSAAQALLQLKGDAIEKSAEFGHDSSLVGWAWVEHTHSWQEPTALAVMALKRAGYAVHPRVREGVRLLADRLFETGGCNYGNTIVLGQTLRPHVQPTGLTLLALAGEEDADGKVQRSIGWLARAIGPTTTPVSLGYALLGLASLRHLPADADAWLSAAAVRELSQKQRPYVLALLTFAAQNCRKAQPVYSLTGSSNHG
jgi:hypothetical protein